MKFNFYLDAWWHCTKQGISTARIRKIGNQYYMVVPADAELGNL